MFYVSLPNELHPDPPRPTLLSFVVQQRKYGDPICDALCVSEHANRKIVVAADGCGWGSAKAEAVQTAVQVATAEVQKKLESTTGTAKTVKIILKAIEKTQQEV